MKNTSTVRFTMDMSTEQHTYLKMLAAKEGASMKEFVTNHLPRPSVGQDMPKEKFEQLLNEIMTDHSDTLRSLSKR